MTGLDPLPATESLERAACLYNLTLASTSTRRSTMHFAQPQLQSVPRPRKRRHPDTAVVAEPQGVPAARVLCYFPLPDAAQARHEHARHGSTTAGPKITEEGTIRSLEVVSIVVLKHCVFLYQVCLHPTDCLRFGPRSLRDWRHSWYQNWE
jgi:hypothetical protein